MGKWKRICVPSQNKENFYWRKMEDGVILFCECNVFVFESCTVDVIIDRCNIKWGNDIFSLFLLVLIQDVYVCTNFKHTFLPE